MNENTAAFSPAEYDEKIKRTLPYYEEFYQQVVDVLRVCHPHALTWLDVGCGTGKMAEEAFRQVKIDKFVFCDRSAEMIEIAKNRFRFPNTEFLVSVVQELDFHSKFDVVTAIQVNHYLQREERREAVRRCYEALKADGVLISFENFAPFSDAGKHLFLERWKAYQVKQGESAAESANHIGRYNKNYFPISLSEHISLMKDCGFRAVEIFWLSYMQVGLLGIK